MVTQNHLRFLRILKHSIPYAKRLRPDHLLGIPVTMLIIKDFDGTGYCIVCQFIAVEERLYVMTSG